MLPRPCRNLLVYLPIDYPGTYSIITGNSNFRAFFQQSYLKNVGRPYKYIKKKNANVKSIIYILCVYWFWIAQLTWDYCKSFKTLYDIHIIVIKWKSLSIYFKYNIIQGILYK